MKHLYWSACSINVLAQWFSKSGDTEILKNTEYRDTKTTFDGGGRCWGGAVLERLLHDGPILFATFTATPHWSSLSKMRGVASLWQYGMCLSRAKGQRAVTDPRVPPIRFPPPIKSTPRLWMQLLRLCLVVKLLSLQVSFFCLQLCLGAYFLTIGALLLTIGVLYSQFRLLYLQWDGHVDGL